MANILIDIKDKHLKNIEKFQSLNKIKTRTKAINLIMEQYFETGLTILELNELNKKIERLLRAVNFVKDLSEQSFANNGFRANKNVKEDEKLQEFYRNLQKNKYNFFD